VNRATEECSHVTGIEARLILCTLRHFTLEQSLATAELVEHFRGSRVAAFDIAGDEAGFPIDAHVAAFRFAIDHGLHRTAHAGEAAGPATVWETLRAFEPSRIGHGVRGIEDPKLLAHLKANGIHLEVCPSSNVQTRAVRSYAEHPVDKLLRSGVSLGINTDTRTITNITLNEEYALLREHFGWSDDEFLTCNRAALRAAFLDEAVRERVLSRLLTS
jgi:adenosine deaminase